MSGLLFLEAVTAPCLYKGWCLWSIWLGNKTCGAISPISYLTLCLKSSFPLPSCLPVPPPSSLPPPHTHILPHTHTQPLAVLAQTPNLRMSAHSEPDQSKWAWLEDPMRKWGRWGLRPGPWTKCHSSETGLAVVVETKLLHLFFSISVGDRVFKLPLAGHRPGITQSDGGDWRHCPVVPFLATKDTCLTLEQPLL